MSITLRPDWIAPRRAALVLVDCQVDFGAPEGEMARRGADIGPAQAAVKNVVALAEAARGAGVTVMFVRLLHRPGDETRVAREARERHGDSEPALCVEGSHGADFIGSQPQAGEAVISKSRFSGFAGTGLDDRLRERGLDTLVLAGLTTECCVQSTAWDGFERDFHILIAADACAAYADDLHRGALKALEMSGATLADAADFIRAWNKIK